MNNLSGLFPLSLYNQSSLYRLSVASNNLHGRLPADLGRSLPSMQRFLFGINQFSGVLPPSLSNMSVLKFFDVSRNEFSGVIPSALGTLQHLQWFGLTENKFEANNEQEWQFLTSLTNCSWLQLMSIEQNRFSGQLPTSLSNCSRLQLMSIEQNAPRAAGATGSKPHFYGSNGFPTELGFPPRTGGEPAERPTPPHPRRGQGPSRWIRSFQTRNHFQSCQRRPEITREELRGAYLKLSGVANG